MQPTEVLDADGQQSGQQTRKELDMRKKTVVGNWKMYTTAAAARRLTRAVVDGMCAEDRVSVAVCPLIGGASLHADQFLAIVRAAILEPESEGESA